jgi:5-formyltetrahydrofolate cyclo-ligase
MRQLPREFVETASDAVIRNLQTVPEFLGASRVFTCLSFGNEVNTWPLVAMLTADASRSVYVPRMDRLTGELHVHPYPCALEILKMGLQQPREGEPEVPKDRVASTIDVALVLGVLFDRSGFRLGYGRGCFDRFLRERSFFTIGLAYERQMVDALPAEPHDVRLDAVVTEENVYRH